ncbi:protein HEG homolog 1 [Rhynchonycteris naso]
MASPRASRWPPPLPLLLLLLLPPLLLPAAPGTWGHPHSRARGEPSAVPLASAGLARPPKPGPEHEPQSLPPRPVPESPGPAPPGLNQTAFAPDAAARPGPLGRGPGGGSEAAVRNHWLKSNTEPHIENIPFDQNQVDLSTVASKEGVMVQTSGKSHAPSDALENFTPQTETADAGGRNSSLRRTNVTTTPVEPEIAIALTSWSSTLALGRLHLPSSSTGSEGRSVPSHSESRAFQGALARGKGVPEEVTVHTQVATSGLSQSSLPALEMGEETTLSRQRNSSEPVLSWLHYSRTSAYSPPSDHSAASRSMEEPNASTALRGPSVGWTKSVHVTTTFPSGVPRVIQSLTASLGPANETDRAATLASVPPPDLRRNAGAGSPGGGESTETATGNGFGLTSSRGSVGLWPNDSPISGGHQQASSSDMSQTETVPGPVPLGRAGESTAHWVWTNSKTFADMTGSSTSYPEVVNSSVLTQFSASAPQPRGSDVVRGERSYSELATESSSSSSSESQESSAPRGERSTTEDSPELGVSVDFGEGSDGMSSGLAGNPGKEGCSEAVSWDTESAMLQGNGTSTGDAHQALGSLAASSVCRVTGISYDQVSGISTEQRTSDDHTDHAYVSSTFSKGERTLLSITDNSSFSDVRESSTSSIQISNSSRSGSPSSSDVQTERSHVSSHGGEYAQPSTESLGLHMANLPSYTPTIHIPKTLVPGAHVGSVGDSSSSGPPLPLPSESQPHQLFPTFSSTGTSAHTPESTPDMPAPLSSSLPPSPVSLTVSTPASLSMSQTTLPTSPSTLVLPRARDTPVTAVRTSTMASSGAVLSSSQTEDPKTQSNPRHEIMVTVSKPPSPGSLPTDATDAETASSSLGIPLPPALTEYSSEHTRPATSASLPQTLPALEATTLKASYLPGSTPSPSSSPATLKASPTTAHTTAGKQFLTTSPDVLAPQLSTEAVVTTHRNQVHGGDTTQLSSLTSVPNSTKALTTGFGISEEYSPASHVLRTSPSPQSTDVSPAEVLTPRSTTFHAQSSTQSATAPSSPALGNSCAPNPCLHGGRCVVDPTGPGYRCVCLPFWQGGDCSVDVNECLSNPCSPLAMCINTQGSFTCRCPVGYQLEKGICNLVRTFVTEFKLKETVFNTTGERPSDLREVEDEITNTLNACFSMLPGYTQSTVHASRESSAVVMSLQTTFSLASNVTLFDLADGMQKCVNSCRSSAEVCQLLGSQRRIFRAGSLCKRKTPECDKETSICTDLDGVALCQCKAGYFQFNKMDHSCRACEDGYRLENETCMSCPFGLGGLNCGNPYQLITVVIAAAGGGLLLILGIALIVTCCRKNKNDISKLIFKSGDFQMSPYAEYPKNPRSQEWGREAIEMHENGSTKNLLQMTDVYYSPTSVRNPELERNGLYPAYTGLPGSRHSCIFPGQYNPSFISDESRRRDYF